jgi:MutS domain V
MCQTHSVSATATYSERLGRREDQLARYDRLHVRIGTARLCIGAAFLIVAWLCLASRVISASWLLVPALTFIALVLYHQRVRALQARAQRAVAFYRRGLARIRDQWHGAGPTGKPYEDPHHIYADDLDLFGKDGLFELLCAARTTMGEAALAQWLQSPADLGLIRERQACITDLRERLDLREELAVQGESAQIVLHPETIIAWARAPNLLDRAWIRWTAPLLAALAVAAAIAWGVAGVVYPLLGVLLVETLVAYSLKERIRRAIADVESAYDGLKDVSLLLNRIEAEQFAAAPLRALIERLSSHSRSASATFSRLATVVNFVESRRNPILAPLLLLVMYPLQVAIAAERWRKANGDAVASWLEVLGQVEALLSLAQYAFEHPEDPFPEFLEGAAEFRAADLGHPLIPAAARVCNTVDICGATRVLLVSGSNMSGKSTLLRTVGINTVLAMAGAPVRATRLQLTPLQVGASIRINDSLHEGSSRFYAEITRLRQLFEPAALPLLFLLDELLQGTNSADRRIGAHGVIRALIARGAIGLISTHDLALTDIDGLAAGALENVHFQDELRDGKLKFDFTLRAGVVTKSNGIELMRSIGLDV